MNNGYPQDYQRGPPPPQQRYPQDAYQQRPYPQRPPQGRGYDHRPPPQRAQYSNQRPPQRPQPPPPPPPPQQQQQQQYHHSQEWSHNNGNGYNNHNDMYDYDDQYGYHDNRTYEDQRPYEQSSNQYPYQEYGYPDEQLYQYDDRSRAHTQRPPPQQHQYQNTHGPPQMTHTATSSTDSRTKPKERDRILQTDPESPKSVPWDNPFGAFPSKKTQDRGNGRKGVEESERVKSSGSQPRSNGRGSTSRPSTSHEQRQPLADFPQRNHTSHTQPGPPPPPRKELPAQATQDHRSEQDREFRTPHRAMTGPVPQHVPGGFDHGPHPGMVRQHTYNDYPSRRPGLQERHDSHSNPRYEQPQQHHYSHSRRQSENSTSHPNQQHYTRQGSFEQQPTQIVTSNHVSQEPPVASTQLHNSPQDIPNFDAMVTTTKDDELSLQKPPQVGSAYHKPTYSSLGPEQDSRSANQHPSEQLVSPLASFSFDLPTENASKSSQPQPWQNQSSYHAANEHQNPVQMAGPPSQAALSQYPPRSASRGDMRPPPKDPRAQPPMPRQDSFPNTRYASHQGNLSREDERYDQPSTDHQANNYGSQPTATGQRPPMYRDPSRSGYDPRLRPERNGTPLSNSQHQDPPSRPITSNSMHNSVHNSVQSSDGRLSSDSYQAGVRSQLDPSSRPVPFRPGLMQPTPPPPSTPPVSVKPVPRQVQPTKPPVVSTANAPITIQELNNLRKSYQEKPDDQALGLRFAKRLVEAAKVLPNQNGTSDPKQIAKNRERYILDAHKIVKRLIQGGYTDAMFYMADCYGQGSLGLQPDPKEAFQLYQSAAKLGHAQSAYRVAVCCELGPEDGGGTRRDPIKAVQWYKRAASLGDAPAMYKMGMVLLKGLLGQSKNPREAISWLKRAAERADEENPHALHELALLYESAQSTDVIIRDEKYALQLFKQAADLGYKYSQFRLGSAYEYGKLGCVIDPRLSIAWYSKAAAQGEHQSEFALSGWYLTGSGPLAPGQPSLLEQSDTEAYLWARKAATSGLAKAEYAMGYYTEVGIGTTSNVDDAKKWYFRAAAQNHPKARERLEDLKRGGARMQKTRVSRSNVGKHNEGECVVM